MQMQTLAWDLVSFCSSPVSGCHLCVVKSVHASLITLRVSKTCLEFNTDTSPNTSVGLHSALMWSQFDAPSVSNFHPFRHLVGIGGKSHFDVALRDITSGFISTTSPDDICYRCQETDSGIYTCLASSSSGETSWSGVLTVKGKASLHAALHA